MIQRHIQRGWTEGKVIDFHGDGSYLGDSSRGGET